MTKLKPGAWHAHTVHYTLRLDNSLQVQDNCFWSVYNKCREWTSTCDFTEDTNTEQLGEGLFEAAIHLSISFIASLSKIVSKPDQSLQQCFSTGVKSLHPFSFWYEIKKKKKKKRLCLVCNSFDQSESSWMALNSGSSNGNSAKYCLGNSWQPLAWEEKACLGQCQGSLLFSACRLPDLRLLLLFPIETGTLKTSKGEGKRMPSKIVVRWQASRQQSTSCESDYSLALTHKTQRKCSDRRQNDKKTLALYSYGIWWD